MTETTGTTGTTGTAPAPDEATPERPTRRRMYLAAMAAGVAALAIGIGAFAASTNDDDPRPVASRDIAAAHQGCQRWLDSDTAQNGPGAAWCDDMAGRMSGRMPGPMSGPMSGRMTDGRMMMGSWAQEGPEAMRDACTQAMSDAGTADGDDARWCDQMADWMSRHEGDWDDMPGNRDN